MAYQKFGHHDSSYIADTIEDLKELPLASMGSTCYVISNATKYIVNSKGEWIAQYTNSGSGSGGAMPDLSNYATKDEIKRLETLINTKQDQLINGENIKTINGQSILGSGDIYADQTMWEGNAFYSI